MRFLGPEADVEVFQSRHLLFETDIQQVQVQVKRKKLPYPSIAIHTKGSHSYLINESAARDESVTSVRPVVDGRGNDEEAQKRCRELEGEMESLKKEAQARTQELRVKAEGIEATCKDFQAKEEELKVSLKENEELGRAKDLEIKKLQEDLVLKANEAASTAEREASKDAEIERLKDALKEAKTDAWYAKHKPTPAPLVASFSQLGSKWEHFYISDWVGDPSPSATVKTKDGKPAYFNDLETIDRSWKPQSLTVNAWSNMIDGLTMEYTNGKQVSNGDSSGSRNATFQLEGSVVEVRAKSRDPNWVKVSEIFFKMADGTEHVMTCAKADGLELVGELSAFAQPGWSLRGFYGQYGNEFASLGLVWGED